VRNKNIAWLQYFTAFCLILTVLAGSSMVALAGTENRLAGEIVVSGRDEKTAVTLNGERALSGQTFFSSGVISTSATGSATINLGKLGHINLSPNSVLSLNFTENSISGTLSAGQIKVFSKEGVTVNIKTIDGTVNNDGNQTGVYTIDVQSGATQTVTEQGLVSLDNGQTNVPLPGGQQQSSFNKRYLLPIIIVSAVVGVAAIVILTRDDDDEVTSPVR
jgi:hypothetical protein